MDAQLLTVGPIQENCYLVRAAADARRAVLVDPGERRSRALERRQQPRGLLARIDEHGLARGGVGADEVAVLLNRPDGEELRVHCGG